MLGTHPTNEPVSQLHLTFRSSSETFLVSKVFPSQEVAAITRSRVRTRTVQSESATRIITTTPGHESALADGPASGQKEGP